jgi:hypothetical protein
MPKTRIISDDEYGDIEALSNLQLNSGDKGPTLKKQKNPISTLV